MADVIALAKATPDGLDWASSGNGTVQHLALEMFKHQAGIKLNHIPYRGGGPVLNDLIGGQVKFYFSNAAASIGHVQSGVLKCLAHTGRGRLATLPDVPAVAEYVRGAAAKIDRLAVDLREKKVGELLSSAADFGRSQPVAMLAGAALVGFALSRVIKAGVAAPAAAKDSVPEYEPMKDLS